MPLRPTSASTSHTRGRGPAGCPIQRGAEAPSGPFSFVPCRPYDDVSAAFARPVLRLPRRWVEPNLAMGAKATAASAAEIRALWEEIVGQVLKDGLALGVHLDPPPHAPPFGGALEE